MRPISWRQVEGRPVWWWGNVVSANPLMVARDGSDVGIPIDDNTSGPLQTGDRVLVQINGNIPAVVGRRGGPRAPQPPAWQSYSPVLMTTGNPQPSGVTPLGRFLAAGEVCHIEVQIDFPGGWSSSGNGFFQLSLPLAPSGYYGGLRGMIGGSVLIDGNEMPMTATIESGTPATTRIRRLLAGSYQNLRESHNTNLAGGRMIFNGSYRIG